MNDCRVGDPGLRELLVRHMRSHAETIKTKRLLLRGPAPADLSAMIAIHGDPRTNIYNPNGPSSHEECRELLGTWDGHWSRHGVGYWAAELSHEPGNVIGFGGVRTAPELGPATANLYFRLAPEAWGRGLAIEIGGAAIRIAFEELNFDRVVGSTRRNNEPSRRTLERLGLALASEKSNGAHEEPSLIYELRKA